MFINIYRKTQDIKMKSYQEVYNEVQKLVEEKVFELGLNTAHDYDGIENSDDLIIYLKAVLKHTKKVEKTSGPEFSNEYYQKLNDLLLELTRDPLFSHFIFEILASTFSYIKDCQRDNKPVDLINALNYGYNEWVK